METVTDLIGKTFVKVENVNDFEIVFVVSNDEKYKLYHSQDCCENVSVEDISGDLNDLVGSPLLMAEEVVSNENPPDVKKDWQESFTWTYYKFATVNGYVTIRWYGESNGYYSERVDFMKC